MNDFDPNQGNPADPAGTQPAGGQPVGDQSGAATPPPAQPAAATPPPVQPAAATPPPVQPVAATPPPTDPAAAQPAGQAAAGGATSDYTFGQIWDNFNTNIQLPPHQLQFDETRFLRLLAGSISLTRDEKWKIIQFVPKLTQHKVEQLMNILEEEQRKFQELSTEHGEHLQKLEEKHASEWKDLEYKFDQKNKRDEDSGKADDIRKSLGL